MKYFSTGKNSPEVSFKEALLQGLAPDKGLYLPESFPKADSAIFEKDSFQDMAFEMAKLLVDGEIPDDDLRKLTDDAFNFDVPVKKVHDNIYALELYHGPTSAFKDFGARFMARAMSYFLGDKKLTILVATSGDTGSAVAKGFYGLPNIDVIILYPSGKVSPLQEKQLTTLGKNITALEIDGTFDECQALVKEAFMDEEVKGWLDLSSANSINIGRLYPQSFYYCWAYHQVKSIGTPVFCTPSGNFGNITGGLIANKMGLPVKHFIAATNINDTVPEYLETGVYRPRPSVTTYSNAMDVGNPSNFARMLEIYGERDEMAKDITGYSVTDADTAAAIKEVKEKYDYLLDPHGAVGYTAVKRHIEKTGDTNTPYVFLETAHPAKFSEVIHEILGVNPEIPETLQEYLNKEKVSIPMKPVYEELKAYLKTRKNK
jgi:threonine synthase